MNYFRVASLLVAISALSADLAAASPESKYFRSDWGHGYQPSGALPSDVGNPDALLWRVELDSGHSTPIISGGKIFLTTYNSAKRELATVALEEKTGKPLWRKVASAQKIEEVHPQMGNPATPTVACDGQRVYSFFGSHGLIAYDLNGNQIWDLPMGPFRDEYGTGSSPIVVDGKIFLIQDHDIDNFVIAVDAATGKVAWKKDRPISVRSYATPVVWNHGGRKELLVAGALELAAYDPASGERLWWANGLARIVIPVPIPDGDMIYMASWAPGGDSAGRITLDSWDSAISKWDKDKDGKLTTSEISDKEVLSRFFRMDLNQDGKLDQTEWERHAEFFRSAQNAILALKPGGKGDVSKTALVWKHQKGIPYVATPLLQKGVIWMVKDGGIATRLDSKTGKVLSEERLPALGNYYASPVVGDGKVYFASEPGVVSVIADSPEWKVISSHKFGEKIYATPLIEGDRIFIRTEKALYCFKQK